MSAFDELERQLIDSVAARRRASRVSAVAGLGRWWRGRLGGGGAWAVAIPLIFVMVTATATMLRPRRSLQTAAPVVLMLPMPPGEIACAPCRAVGGRLHAPLSGEGPVDGASTPGPAREVHIRRGLPIVFWASPEEKALVD